MFFGVPMSIPTDVAEPHEATQNDKGKAKDTAKDKENLDDTEETYDTEKDPKRNWTWKTSESSTNYEDTTSDDEAETPLKRVKRKKSIDDVPPCQQCSKLKKECISNGRIAACKSCRKAKGRCSLAKVGN